MIVEFMPRMLLAATLFFDAGRFDMNGERMIAAEKDHLLYWRFVSWHEHELQ